tara:strand:- start:5273 stop:5638 length:366 start_codon:yes stop_codon:yes gene_type:complete
MNVLLVEDEPLIQKSLKKLMEKRGATVDAVSSGKEAITHILNNDYDRIVCDLMLQDTTGFDVIEESKKKFSREDIARKFVVITAYTSAQVHDKAATYGCRVIGKPFEDLEAALKIFTTKGE